MIRLISILLLLHTVNKANSQEFIKYYEKINQAELFICSNQLSKALVQYKLAFQINKNKRSSIDLTNAFHVAMDLDSVKLAKMYFSEIAKRGITYEYFKKYFLDFYSGDKAALIKNIYQKSKINTILNTGVIDSIEVWTKKDQETRRYFSKQNDGNYMTDSVDRVDRENAMNLKKLFDKYGIPSDFSSGHYDGNPIGWACYSTLLMHAQQSYFRGNLESCFLFDSLLWVGLTNYSIRPSSFGFYIGLAYERFKDSTFKTMDSLPIQFPISIVAYMDWNGKMYPQKLDSLTERRIDENRRKIGLESLNELRMKIDFKCTAELSKSQNLKYHLNTSTEQVFMSQDPQNDSEWIKKMGY